MAKDPTANLSCGEDQTLGDSLPIYTGAKADDEKKMQLLLNPSLALLTAFAYYTQNNTVDDEGLSTAEHLLASCRTFRNVRSCNVQDK
jgi:hypothetical protein